MKLRRRKGATLGLVAVCVLVLAIIGFGFFFLSKIMGGGREVANATDAGALNVAKLALTQVTEPGAQDFQGLGVDANGVPTGNAGTPINLLSYNRAVGQALIVALNAQAIGPASYGNANQVVQELRDLGLALQNKLRQGGQLNTFFTNLAGINNVKMMGPGSNVNVANDVTSAYINPNNQGKTNIYLNTSVLDQLGIGAGQYGAYIETNGLKSKGGWSQGGGQLSLANQPYLKGYTPLSVPNMSNIVGAVVLPQNKPHLVNLGDFQAATTPIDYAPPNSWRANSTSQETSKTGNWAGAVACAIVGTLGAEYEAAIPRGYIRLRNFQSADVANGGLGPVSDIDGSNSIFNNELFMGAANPTDQGPIWNTNGGKLFTNDGRDPGGAAIQAWADYNNSAGQLLAGDVNLDTDNKDSRKDPLGAFQSAGNPITGAPQQVADSAVPPGSVIRSHDGSTTSVGKLATLAELKTITGKSSCETMDYGAGVVGNCTDANADLWSTNYGRFLQPSSAPAPSSTTMSNVEYLKGNLIDQFSRKQRCGTISSPPGSSGMKVYERNGGYNTNRVAVRFGTIGSPYQLLQHVGGCAIGGPNNIVDAIWQRMREINPACTRNDAITALSAFPMPPAGTNPNAGDGSYQYIYSNGPGQKPTAHLNAPPWAPGAATQIAEGSSPPCDSTVSKPVGEIINSARGAGSSGAYNSQTNGKGDTNIHDVMYQNYDPNCISAWDTAEWKPSCGYRNFLGEITFKNTTQGGGQFCKPN